MPKNRSVGLFSAACAVAATVALVACGGDDPAAPPTGQLRLALTDAPGCAYDNVTVTVERLRVHRSAAAGEAESGWIEIPVVGGPKTIDLLTLNNGIVAELGQTTLPAGQYQQIRLVLAANRGNTVANSVTPRGMTAQPLETPSGAQSGIKLTHGFTVEPNALTDLLLDFEACKSVVERGNGTYGLKPVIAVMPRTGAGIEGFVDTTVADVTVSAQRNGVVLRATRPGPDGRFLLLPVHPVGVSYEVVFTAPDRTTMVVGNVPAVMNQITRVNTSPLTLPPSASGTVTGTVTPTAAVATVRALQKVGAIAAIEVGWSNTSLVGGYTLKLPTAEPRLADYVKQPASLNFVAQGGARQYTLEASATGYRTVLGSPVSVTEGGTLPGQDFALITGP